jgi:hypothetical protein
LPRPFTTLPFPILSPSSLAICFSNSCRF